VIAEETDIPAGIVAVLPSARLETAQALTSSPDVDAIAFTGSTHTGEAVMRSASSTLTKVCLELGGKSPSIFLPDADLAFVLPFAAGMAMFNAGQSCIMPSRMLVPIEQFDRCLDLAVEGMAAVHWGDPWSPETFMGPLISADRRNEVVGVVRRSAEHGARIVCGGNAIPGPGFFMEPTLIADLDGSSEAAQQEIFGPVVVMTPYTSVEHAIELANDTEFGLAAYVWGASAEDAAQVGSRIRAGMVGINGGQFTSADMPFGGMRRSGIGREWGVAGMEEFLETRTMATRIPVVSEDSPVFLAGK
jgi:acyl-CoA reductase-like NAD-dependent aldehyde dehydrogenase